MQQKLREERYVALSRSAISRFEEAPTPGNLDLLFHSSFTVTPDDLRKTILDLAVQGKLVSELPDADDPLLTFSGLRTIRNGSEGEESVPRSWALASYRDLTSLVTSGSRGWKEFYSDSGSIFIRTQNIKTDRLVLAVC